MDSFDETRADEIDIGDVVRIVTDPTEMKSLWVVVRIGKDSVNRSNDSVKMIRIDEFGGKKEAGVCGANLVWYLRCALALVRKSEVSA